MCPQPFDISRMHTTAWWSQTRLRCGDIHLERETLPLRSHTHTHTHTGRQGIPRKQGEILGNTRGNMQACPELWKSLCLPPSLLFLRGDLTSVRFYFPPSLASSLSLPFFLPPFFPPSLPPFLSFFCKVNSPQASVECGYHVASLTMSRVPCVCLCLLLLD